MEEGEIEVDSIERIGFPDITPELARESCFLGVLDLLKKGARRPLNPTGCAFASRFGIQVQSGFLVAKTFATAMENECLQSIVNSFTL
jgi:hypothetical protein